jgi:pimeloyl-ACP methyl ester carboxylesterase
MIDIGGRSLHLHCAGEGTPVVVFDAGLGEDGSTWSQVQPEVARHTRACVYDRAGTGYSSPAPRPHTTAQMVEELHALLGRAGVEGPYVLVGHSLGGLNVQLYVHAHPAEVAGMVLVDSVTRDQGTRLWELLPAEMLRGFEASLSKHREGLDYASFRAGMAALGAPGRTLGDAPLVVLTRGQEDPPSPGVTPEVVAKTVQAWREMQAELPRLSTNSAHLVAENSRHYVQWDAAKLVTAAVRAVVDAARSRARVDARALAPLARLPREEAP